MSALHGLATAVLRGLDAETAHGLTIRALKAGLGPRAPRDGEPALAVDLCGLKLPNCVGLAAGFDKNAEVPDAMLAAGFGFAECGTVTPLPQAGNPKPRIFRLTEDRGVINRLGFNNGGLDAFAARLARRPRRGVVGANIGANKDFRRPHRRLCRRPDPAVGPGRLFHGQHLLAQYAGLRDLQGGEALQDLLGRLAEARAGLPRNSIACPVFLKVAPDLEDAQIDAIVEAALQFKLDALIVSNTTLQRPADLRSANAAETGGLSGAPEMAISTETLARFHARTGGAIALIGVGGIASGADAYAKIRAGARAVQLYSAMVYEGPGLVTRVRRELAARLQADGFTTVSAAVGAR